MASKLFSLTIALGAGACTVYMLVKSSIVDRQSTVAQDVDINEPPVQERDEELEEVEDTDLLTSYWAGSIPEGTSFSSSSVLSHSSEPVALILN